MDLKKVLKILVEKMQAEEIDFALIGGLALSTMDIFRFTRDLDFLVHEEAKEKIHTIMTDLSYEKQDFSGDEIVSYFSPLATFGQVDFLLARRKYTKAMMSRAEKKPVFDEACHVKTLVPEDIIGLKIQAIHNDPVNRLPIDGSDIQQLLRIYHHNMDMGLVREYFKIFEKEQLLDEWLDNIKR